MRDSQRQRVYDAEKDFREALGSGTVFRSQFDLCQYVFNLVGSNWYQKEFPGPSTVTVQVTGRVRGGKAFWKKRLIKISPKQMNEFLILHELAHIAAPARDMHGHAFCARLLKLVGKKMGAEAEEKLKECFKAYKVRFRPKKKSVFAKGTMPPGFAALQKWREEHLKKAS